MKQIAFYRRSGRPGTFRGLKERVTWMIQSRGRPVTGSEIAEKFGVSLCEFNKVARGLTKGSKVVKIKASEPFTTDTGIVDRFFSLESNPRRDTPRSRNAVPPFSRRSREHAAKNCREEYVQKAERRRRLIKAGLYIDEFENAL
ncbi:regulator [Escherichia coli]